MLRKLIRFSLAGVFSVGIGALAPAAFAADQPMQDTDKPAEQGQAAQEKAAQEKAAQEKAAADQAAKNADKPTPTSDEAAKQGADKAKQDDTNKQQAQPFEGAVRPAD